MKITPKTEKEIKELRLLPDGWLPFTILSAHEGISKKGNEMITIDLKVYRGDGYVIVRDWLLDGGYHALKLLQFAEACGLEASYQAGLLSADDMDGREGWAKVATEKSKDDRYPDKNKITAYSKEEPKRSADKPRASATTSPLDTEASPDDDDIPF